MHRQWKKPLAAAVSGALIGLSLTALAAVPAQAATTPAMPFPQHQTYQVGVMPSASQSARDTAVEKQYDSWKAAYLVHGCASNEYYVSTKGDNDATNGGTVSEAQGYGMNIVPLMAGYDPNAQTEFNGLWQLVKDHHDQYGLMQWQLDGKSCNYYSSGTPDSATDGDLDIGYGLVLADRQWGGYTADAMTWLNNFWNHDVASDGHLKCEDDGPSTDTRPSDNMLDHLRAFAAYDTSHDWSKVVNRMQAVVTEFTGSYSSGTGLMSDFVINANTTSPSPAPANYQENQPDNIVGYNSIRVPWHLGTDALLYGSSTAAVSYTTAVKESTCLKSLSGGNPANVQPHIKLNCANGNVSGDTQAEEAGDSVGPAAMASGDQAWTDAIWNQLASNPFGDHYYGETIKTLVSIVMAGDYWNPTAAAAPGNDFSLSASPAADSVSAGLSVTATISTAVTSGAGESVTLSASGAPAGATVGFSPASITSGDSSTMTVSTSSSTPAGSYPITITGTAPSGSHIATYTVTVTGGGGGGGGTITGNASGLCLSVTGNSTSLKATADINSCDGDSSEQWTVNADGTVVNGASGLCLSVSGASTSSKATADVYTCNGSASENWTVNSDGTIVGNNSGLCLSVTGGSTSPGATADIYTCNGSASENWTVG